MVNRLFVLSLVGAILQFGHPSSVNAQRSTQPRYENIRVAVARLVERGNSRVVVKMTNGVTLKGSIVRVDTDSFELADDRSATISTIRYEDIRKINKYGMSNAAKAAIWIGVAAGAAVLFIKFPTRRIGPICPLGCGL